MPLSKKPCFLTVALLAVLLLFNTICYYFAAYSWMFLSIIITITLLGILVLRIPLLRFEYRQFKSIQHRMEEVEKSELLLRTIIDTTPDPIFIKDVNHRFKIVNKAYADLTNLNIEDLIGKTDIEAGIPEEIVRGNPAKGMRGYWEDDMEVLTTGVAKQISEEMFEVNGVRSVFTTLKVPLKEKEGKVWGILGFIHDITPFKEHEETLKKAKDIAEEANRTKSDFMANMSHELRTPMNGIIGFTDLVLTTELQAGQREYLRNVNKSAYNLLNIINDILDFSKIEAGKLLLDHTSFKLNEIIEEAVDILSIKAVEKNLELICDMDPLLPSVFMGDPVRMQQVLVNLLGNAIKFTEQGEICLTVRRAGNLFLKENKHWLNIEISVKDSGIGIEEDKLQRIFESFTQADASTTRKFGGTGLGLTISRNLLQLMEGDLLVESEYGKGSTFKFTIPLEMVEEAPSFHIRNKPLLRQVLVIDDNSTNCKLMQGIFKFLDIPCTICYDGYSALDILSKEIAAGTMFDLIITDHQMPGMDGITLVKEMKRILPEEQEPYILMLSSLERTLYQHEARNIGISKFLSKPVKLYELQSLLTSIFDRTNNTLLQPSTQLSAAGEGLTILVAEDDPINMILITSVLEKMGCRVLPASNGIEAVATAQAQPVDLILMDINMPEMDGFTATRQIRRLNTPVNNISIIALTADAMQEDKQKAFDAGMNDFISKPFQLKEIAALLNRFREKISDKKRA